MKILILGVTGMLGNAVYRTMAAGPGLQTYGTVRNESARRHFSGDLSDRLIVGIDVENHDAVVRAFAATQPDVVINCVGLVKQLADANDPLLAVPINTLLPHRLAALCQVAGARLVHVSTDCVFSGAQGNYREDDFPDAHDLYGRSKLLGEVDYPHAITLRTSIIGHELAGHRSLVGWFLAQEGTAKGYTKAIFSGLPTMELARVMRDVVLPQPQLRGLFHVAAEPINKCELLKLVARTYQKDIVIVPDESLVIDRSLNAERFRQATGYVAPRWTQLVEDMHAFG
jgi:dTDP-4-dehydrorhamnose reductase